MIRYINLENQIIEGEKMFAFYNTVTDKFETFSGNQTWDDISSFKVDFVGDNLDRYLNLIPEVEVFRIKDLIRGDRFIFNDTSFLVTRKYLDDNKPLIAMNEKALVREHFNNEEMVIEKKI